MVIQNMCEYIHYLGAYVVISTNDEYAVVAPGYTTKILPVRKTVFKKALISVSDTPLINIVDVHYHMR